MAKYLSFLFLSIVLGVASVQAAGKWPSAKEQAKAPAWPVRYSGNPSSCKEPNTDPFYAYMQKHGYVDDKEFEIDAYIDLNLDGDCEIIAYQMSQCTATGCRYIAFHLNNKKVRNIGQVDFGEYLSPVKGWLQLKSKSSSGNNYKYQLYKYVNGAYRVVRTDHYKYSNKHKTTQYLHTESGKHNK